MTADFCSINCFTSHRCSDAAAVWSNPARADS